MNRNRIEFKITKQVTKLNLTASQWALYTPLSVDAGYAANDINYAVKLALNNPGNGREKAYAIIYQTLERWESFGATDSEPLAVLDDILDEFYN